MFDITLITMGKLKEPFYLSAAAEYEKRMKGYCTFHLLELPEYRLPEDPSPAEITAGLEKEAELIFSKVPKGAWLCVLTCSVGWGGDVCIHMAGSLCPTVETNATL